MSTQSRQEILNAAKTLFAEKGFAATTIRDIAKLAKVNSCMISYYFQGKDGLLQEIVDGVFSNEAPLIFNILSSPVENLDQFQIRLELFIDSLIMVGINNWEVIRILRRETHELTKRKEFNQASLENLNLLAHFIAAAQKQKLVGNKVSAFTLADSILAIVLNHISDWKLNRERLQFNLQDKKTRQEWIKEILQLLLYGAIPRQ